MQGFCLTKLEGGGSIFGMFFSSAVVFLTHTCTKMTWKPAQLASCATALPGVGGIPPQADIRTSSAITRAVFFLEPFQAKCRGPSLPPWVSASLGLWALSACDWAQKGACVS